MKVFYRHLPVEDMVCDVSLFTSKALVARKYCHTCGLKLSLEADVVIHRGDKAHHETHDYRSVWGRDDYLEMGGVRGEEGVTRLLIKAAMAVRRDSAWRLILAAVLPYGIVPPCFRVPRRFVDWGVVGPKDATEGLVQGITSFTHEFIGSVAGVVTEPVVGAHRKGVRGAAKGLASGLVNLVRGAAVILGGGREGGMASRDRRVRFV